MQLAPRLRFSTTAHAGVGVPCEVGYIRYMQSGAMELVYRLPKARKEWALGEETMPESVLHDEAVALLRAILAWWARGHHGMQVARNLAIRWDQEHPQFGIDPDVCVLSPAPPEGRDLRSVRTWMPDHHAPVLAIEVVSESNPRKDYEVAPEKYAASGTRELWIFDPLLSGPSAHGGPHRIQVWQRDADDRLVRTYAGDGPARSTLLGAYLVVVSDGVSLRIAEDADGTLFWLTSEEAERTAKEAERTAKEAERTAKEAERTAKEAERTAKEAALLRIAELEAQLAEKAR
jgi:Uma2 family endonuclease